VPSFFIVLAVLTMVVLLSSQAGNIAENT
jgi:hypothetical protein